MSFHTINHVTLVSPAWPPGNQANGIITYVQYLRSGLQQLGIECTIATKQRFSGDDAKLIGSAESSLAHLLKLAARAGWRVFPRTAAKVLSRLDTMDGFRRLERETRFDILEMEESFGFPQWVAGAVAAPIVVRLHGPWLIVGAALGAANDAEFHDRVTAEGLGITAAAAVSAPSRHVLERVRQHYGLELPNAAVIPNPGPEPCPGEAWDPRRAEPGNVVFVGRFDRVKGGDLAIDAFALLADRIPSLRLTIAGPDNGVVDDSGKRWAYADYVQAKIPPNHRHRIEFLGRVDQSAISDLRRRASVVISASRFENFPMTVLEAMSQGCPLICPDCGGVPEIVENEANGLLFPAGDAHALAERIESLVGSTDRAAQLGAAALIRYRERYLPRQVAGQTLEFYREVRQRHLARKGR